MSSLLKSVAAAAVFGLAAVPAAASDVVSHGAGHGDGVASKAPVEVMPVAPAPRPRIDWTGPYAGASLGVGRASSPNQTQTSAIGNVFAGYKYDMGDTVAGVDLTVSPASVFGNFSSGGETLRWGVSLTGSVGMKVDAEGRTLVHAGAGPAWVRTRDQQGVTSNALGLSVGAGVDHLVDDSIMLRTGILYSRFGSVGTSGQRVNAYSGYVGAAFRF
ncbi:MAG: porin family protein [Rhodobacteraceae bacterium]|nr:porin family protein [Paracoccaceae bacterium]